MLRLLSVLYFVPHSNLLLTDFFYSVWLGAGIRSQFYRANWRYNRQCRSFFRSKLLWRNSPRLVLQKQLDYFLAFKYYTNKIDVPVDITSSFWHNIFSVHCINISVLLIWPCISWFINVGRWPDVERSNFLHGLYLHRPWMHGNGIRYTQESTDQHACHVYSRVLLIHRWICCSKSNRH